MRSLAQIVWDRNRVLTSAQKERKRERSRWTMRRLRASRPRKPKKDRFSWDRIWAAYMGIYRSENLRLERDTWAGHPMVYSHYSSKKYYAAHEENKALGRLKAKERYASLSKEEKQSLRKRKYSKLRIWKKQPRNRIKANVRSRVHKALNAKFSKSYTGCTKDELMDHLARSFRYRMSFENYGRKWHIDHIVPLSKWDLTNPDHVRRANHFTNLQPMWGKENIKKGDKFTGNLLLPLPYGGGQTEFLKRSISGQLPDISSKSNE